MAKTAVGLFENSGSADGVVRDLTAKVSSRRTSVFWESQSKCLAAAS
jgi:hypothetical protein